MREEGEESDESRGGEREVTEVERAALSRAREE